ncbi:armadillo repeat-containing protein 2 [Drosophila obscura]|uniref:armadillo repeat-containing protein 2 n=1 Tax=Drosophila obscura TaxID=7282 RepID=UPI000BA0B232|nr:armadillo repeat-containing protein 2 [Drosophila obscura]XP_022214041.1 armadillo repeat-containing protein 2 [Drosophila obscura]XP_041451395.1 armadillo repeat-containing protein 2 [Drosophila obscura]
MSLLLKRRSHSETRPKDVPDKSKQQSQPQQKHQEKHELQERPQQIRGKPHSSEQSLNRLGMSHQQQSTSFSMAGGMGRRKTSAELISEAKLFLGETVAGASGGGGAGGAAMQMMATGGARLVSTRRPITPREPGRVLYGKVALAGRPPSAFSMRYLQNEKPAPRQLPALSGTGPTTPMPTRNGALLGQSTTETLIELLKQHSGLKECTNETVQHINAILQELYTRVRKQERNFKRGFILGGLYGLVECTSPRVLLAVARVVLALRVTGSNLTGACKLIFKVARHEQNDGLFHDHDVLELLIDGLGRASPLDEPEACIYAYGCIRFLTASSAQDRDDALNRNWIGLGEAIKAPLAAPVSATLSAVPAAVLCPRKLTGQQTLVSRLARHGAVELMILHLQMLNEAGATKRLTGPPLHTLYQLSAAMRALADVSQQQQRLQLQLQLACPHLIRAAEVSMGELEVQANVVRTLSVLSEDSDCCETLHNYAARIGLLLGPSCSSSGASERLLAVLSRLGYMLGNILAKHESARIQYFHNDVAMEYLLNVLEQLGERSPSSVALLDAQIKLIRVVANMSVNPEVGAGLGNVRCLGSVLLKLLSHTSASLAKKKSAEHQELLHATLGALHNLCFYQDKQTTDSVAVPATAAAGSLQSLIDELSASLAEVLANCQTAATKVELTRVLGNLTRNERARRCFCAAGGLPLMVQQLTRQAAGQDYELRTCAIGVLVNLLGDGEQRAPFLQLRGAELLSLLLRGSLEQEDWFLANIVCQALWNLLIDGQCAVTLCRSGSILDEVSDLLADYLDEDRLNAGDGDDDDEQPGEDEHELETEKETDDDDGDHDALWEDFALVATDLLERIQNNFDRQQPQTVLRTDNDDDGDVFIEEM